MDLAGLTLYFYLGFFIVGLIVSLLMKFWSKLVFSALFFFIVWQMGEPAFGLMFLMGVVISWLVVDYIFGMNDARQRRKRKDLITI